MKLIHLTRFSGRASAVLGEMPVGSRRSGWKGRVLMAILVTIPRQPRRPVYPLNRPLRSGPGTFTPEGVIACRQRTQLEEFAVGHNHLSAEDASVRKPDAVAQRRPAVADQVGDGRSLRAAAADHHVSPMLHAFFLDGRVDHAGAYFHIKVLFIEHEIVHAFEIDQQGIFHMGMGARPVKPCAVRHIGDVVAVTDLNDPLNFFRGPWA